MKFQPSFEGLNKLKNIAPVGGAGILGILGMLTAFAAFGISQDRRSEREDRFYTTTVTDSGETRTIVVPNSVDDLDRALDEYTEGRPTYLEDEYDELSTLTFAEKMLVSQSMIAFLAAGLLVAYVGYRALRAKKDSPALTPSLA